MIVALVALAAVDAIVRWHSGHLHEGVPAVRVQIWALGTALDTFRCDVGRYPTSDEGLRALRDWPAGLAAWDGPYLTKNVPADPWNRPYIYRAIGDGYELSSLGADARPGGRGDDADEVGRPEPWVDGGRCPRRR